MSFIEIEKKKTTEELHVLDCKKRNISPLDDNKSIKKILCKITTIFFSPRRNSLEMN